MTNVWLDTEKMFFKNVFSHSLRNDFTGFASAARTL